MDTELPGRDPDRPPANDNDARSAAERCCMQYTCRGSACTSCIVCEQTACQAHVQVAGLGRDRICNTV